MGSESELLPDDKEALAVENDGLLFPVPTVVAGVPLVAGRLALEGIAKAETAVSASAGEVAGIPGVVFGVKGFELVAALEACCTLAITSSGSAKPPDDAPVAPELAGGVTVDGSW